MTEPSALSVIVATRNRSASLARLLSALADQTDAPPFEVIVADNGSTDDTPEVLRREFPGLTLRSVRVGEAGKGRALNAAVRIARGHLIVFTDDDVEPDSRWLTELRAAAARHPEIGIFGGRVEVDHRRVPAWIRRSHNLMGLLTSEHEGGGSKATYEFGRYPFGPNMAVRRDKVAGVESPYPEDLGPGTDLPVGDESAFLMRISPPEGTDRLYVPTARVQHEVEPENVTFRVALKRSYLQGRAQGRLGIAVVPPSTAADGGSSFLTLALARAQACGSLREFFCVCVRQLGYLKGVREGERISGPRGERPPHFS